MHRDLKPDNILMHDGMIKLGDFGFCKPLDSALEMANTMLGSPIYMAPEVLKGETYNMKADIWSLGVVLFQMVFARCPFESKSIAKLIKLLEEEDLAIPTDIKISTHLEKLLRKMLVKDFTVRI
jgi:serine/threonine-protein kinase ULK2